MEKYIIQFKRRYNNNWIDIPTEYNNLKSAKNIISNMLKNDFYARDYDYEYRIVKNGEQIGDIYHLVK